MSATVAEVKDVMTNEVVAVRRDASFKEMAARLRQYRVSAFPVIDENRRVIGVVSEADLLAEEALADEHGIPAAVTGILHHKEHQKSEGLTAGRPDDAPGGHGPARRLGRARRTG